MPVERTGLHDFLVLGLAAHTLGSERDSRNWCGAV